MLKTANKTFHKSDFDRMAGWTGWFWASSWYVVILLSCLIRVVLFLSWIPVSGLSNVKVSNGSQPPAASASPLGVPGGCPSLDRLVGRPFS
jgi:hypothetical protein